MPCAGGGYAWRPPRVRLVGMDRLEVPDTLASAPAAGDAADEWWRRRAAWAAGRAAMETRVGRARKGRIAVVRAAQRLLGPALRLAGLHGPGVRNALDLRLERHAIELPGLPPELDGYRILHASDLHVDVLADATAAACRLVSGLTVDLCVLTGDYVQHAAAEPGPVVAAVRALVDAVACRDGALATLGNHDGVRLVAPLAAAGIRVLVNETVEIRRGGGRLRVTGLDDVHRFHTAAALAALEPGGGAVKIALVHSPEAAAAAAAAGYALYLAGHTHGGQVCLPGGRPVATNIRTARRQVAGLWRCGGMVGYTNRGVGVSPPPVRFNCRGEVALLTLRRPPGLARGQCGAGEAA